MQLLSADAEQKYAALVAVASHSLVALDFDGTLAPIVDDPAGARMHPEAADVLTALATHVAAVAVITGRPARQVLALGGLETLGDRMESIGKELLVFGQYGAERWSSSHRAIIGPRPPAGLASLSREIPHLLRLAKATDAHVESKGLAVAIHTRRLPDADEAFARLLPVLAEAAERYGLDVEPGKKVVELRSGEMDKGIALDRLVDRFQAKGILLAGDDLGDIEAFESARAWQLVGRHTFCVCSASEEESALLPLSDAAVRGPDGVMEFLREFSVAAS